MPSRRLLARWCAPPALVSAVLCGCAAPPPPVPVEQAPAIIEAITPGLHEYQSGVGSRRTMYLGDVVSPGKVWPTLRWQGDLEGERVFRTEKMIEVKAFAADGVRWIFKDALGAPVDVPTLGWLCDRLGNPAADGMPCIGAMRRVVVPGGAFVAYLSCSTGGCPIAVVRAGQLKTTTVEGLSDFRLLVSGDRAYGVARSRWARSPDHTGGSAVVFEISPGFERLAEILVDEVDARMPDRVTSRLGRLVIKGSWIDYEGTVSTSNRLTGAVIGEPQKLREDYWISPGGQFFGR